MNDARARTALGFAARARKCESGDFACETSIKRGKAKAVVIDSGVSDNTREKYARLCASLEIPVYEMDGLGETIGKPDRMTVAVTDGELAKMLIGAYAPEKEN